VRNAPEFAQIKIPAVGIFGQAVFVDALEQQVIAGHAFRAADDFTITLGGQ